MFFCDDNIFQWFSFMTAIILEDPNEQFCINATNEQQYKTDLADFGVGLAHISISLMFRIHI